MPEEKLLEWQCPALESSAKKRQGWVEEAVQEGEKWWESQPAADSEQFLNLLSCKGTERLKSNSLKIDVRKFVETISDIREIATYGAADQFTSNVQMFNKLVQFVYQDSFFPRQSRQSLQYAVGLARGYIWPRFKRTQFGWGPGKVVFESLGPREALPLQVPRDNDQQEAYGQTIVECMGIAEAHARFPRYQDKLVPISKFKYSSNAQVRRHEFWDKRYGNEAQDWERRYCEIRYSFVRDLRVNRTGKMLPMGEKNTSWYYEVPSVGSLIPWLNPDNGLPASKTAKADDCRVYPQLRQLITNPGMDEPMYDGPAFDMHGILPAVAYDVDDWPWLAVGYSLLHDVASIEKGERAFIDLMYRVLRRKMNPPLGHDLDAGVPRDDIKNFDWLDEGAPKIGVTGDPKKALVSLLPESIRVEGTDFQMVELLDKLRQKSLGLNDLNSLAQMKMNLSSDNFDKVLESIGPIAKGISLNMQVAHSKIAHMLKYIILQYFSTRRVLSIVGPDGIDSEVFDFDPTSLIPSHMPWESDKGKASQCGRNERARWMADNLIVKSVPSALINVTQMQEKMIYMNALQRGWPVSFSTAFKKIGIDWPETPGANEFEKYKTEQVDLLEMKLTAAKIAGFELGGSGGGSDGKKGGEGKGKGGGRPPSGQEPPKLEKRGTKDGNLRTVVSQSK